MIRVMCDKKGPTKMKAHVIENSRLTDLALWLRFMVNVSETLRPNCNNKDDDDDAIGNGCDELLGTSKN